MEVSYLALGPFLDALRARGIDPDPLLADLPIAASDARRIRGGFDWATFSELTRRATRALGGTDELEAAIHGLSATESFAFIRPVIRAIVRPRDLMWMGTRWFGTSLFRIVDAAFEDLADGRVRETLAIPEPYEDLPEFFLAMRGSIRSAPRFIGLGDALVELELAPRRAVYTIELPSRSSSVQVLEPDRREEVLRSIEEMAAQMDDLRDSQVELRKTNEELEERVRERSLELLAARTRLEEARRLASLGTLAAGISHEINNPLAAIQATAQLARATGGLDDSDVLDKIVDEAKRCSRIVRSLLQFARDETTEKWEISIDEVVRRAVEAVRDLANGAAVSVVLDANEEHLLVLGNPVQLDQMLLNVLQNAIEHSPRESEVVLRTGPLGSFARISVQDDGAGIAAEALPRIFEPFFTTRLGEGGSGLGFSLAREIVEEHEGRIEVDSTVGVGTRLVIDLPLYSEAS